MGVIVRVTGLPVTVMTYKDGVGVHKEELEDELATALEVIGGAGVVAVLDGVGVGVVIVGVVTVDDALDVGVALGVVEVVGLDDEREDLEGYEGPPGTKLGRDDGSGAEVDDMEGV